MKAWASSPPFTGNGNDGKLGERAAWTAGAVGGASASTATAL